MADLSNFESAAKALNNSIRCYILLAEREDIEHWLASVSEALTQLERIVKIPQLTSDQG